MNVNNGKLAYFSRVIIEKTLFFSTGLFDGGIQVRQTKKYSLFL